jgi:3-oxoacyl-ACP reductase-like protein
VAEEGRGQNEVVQPVIPAANVAANAPANPVANAPANPSDNAPANATGNVTNNAANATNIQTNVIANPGRMQVLNQLQYKLTKHKEASVNV